MKDKLKVVKVANALAIVSAVVYLICIISIWLAPGFSTVIGNYLSHGLEISGLVVQRSFGFSVVSLILGTAAGWLTGAFFAIIYNWLR